MIVSCRLISTDLISKNVRTFFTSRKVLNLKKIDLQLNGVKIGKYWTPKKGTNDAEYR